MKTVIIGGVAAGASAAARLRRLDENAEIIVFERGDYISYANCGLPYHIGKVIPERESLLLMTPEKFKKRFNADVRVKNEAVSIDRAAKKLTVKRLSDGSVYEESYDKLLIATGSSPIQVKMPGIDDPAVMTLWTVPDMDKIGTRIIKGAKKAVVIGAGFIGLELAENLRQRGLDVTVVELEKQVMPPLDPEMSSYISTELIQAGIALELGQKVIGFERVSDILLNVKLGDGRSIPCDFAVMSIGVRPNSELAKNAGLDIGPRGHIITDESMRTSDPDIYAAGDAVEVADPILGGRTAIPLAGPANKQGRVVADNIAGRKSAYKGTYGSTVVKIGNLTAGSVGLSEKRLRNAGVEYQKIYLHPASNASYYPGGSQMHMKVIFNLDGRILGAQIVGEKGVDKRIDVITSAMSAGLTVTQLAEFEPAYAPPYNSAKDPVNMAGMIAENVLSGYSRIVHSDSIPVEALIVDVSEPEEFSLCSIPGAVNIPLGQLRSRLGEIDKARMVVTYCKVGFRGYMAERILRAKGFDAYNLSGGLLTWKQFNAPASSPAEYCVQSVPSPVRPASPAAAKCVVDARALQCPGPIVRLKKEMDSLAAGDSLQLLAQPSFSPDLANWVKSTGNELVSLERKGDYIDAVIRKAGGTIQAGQPDVKPCSAPSPAVNGHSAAIVLFSNDLDKAMAALIIACGMAASGAKVGIFFTFWGLSVLRKAQPPAVKKNLMSRMFGMMLPKGAAKLTLSKMNMGGMGTLMMKNVMAQQNVTTLPDLIVQARELGVKFIACEMAMNVMGITREELIEVDDVAGVASFVELAKHSNNTLFI